MSVPFFILIFVVRSSFGKARLSQVSESFRDLQDRICSSRQGRNRKGCISPNDVFFVYSYPFFRVEIKCMQRKDLTLFLNTLIS